MRSPRADLALIRLADADADRRRAQALFEACDAFQRLIYRRPTLPTEGDALFDDLPPGVAREAKEVWGVERGGALIGVLELVRGFPAAGESYLGLLLLAPGERGAGLGAALLDSIEEHCRAAGDRALYLAVVERNVDAVRFWQRHGFTEVHRRAFTEGGGDTLVFRLRKPL